MSPRILIFAKAPLPGHAKTRLIPKLGKDAAADLALRMLQHTLAEVQKLAIDVELCVSPGPQHSFWTSLGLGKSFRLSDQGEGELGERLARASQRALAQASAVFLIGTDCPDLGAPALEAAQRALESSDAVLIPTVDGGYALLGLKRFDPKLFEGIAWSTDAVARQTLDRIAALGWTVRIQPTLRDIDEPADLDFLPESLAVRSL